MKRVLAVALLVLAAATTAQAGSSDRLTVRYTAVQTGFKTTEAGFVWVEKALQNGKRVGKGRLTCTVGRSVTRCAYRVTLPGGTISGRTVLRPGATSGTIVVTAGTGVYAGVVGNGTYRNLNDSGTRTGISLALLRPDDPA